MFTTTSNFLDKLDQVIERHLDNEAFSIEQLCLELTISYTHVYRQIKEATGLSPSLYIRQKRLERAAYLLQTSTLSIAEIAYQVGFNTPNYFTTCFLEQYDCTPSVYRKECEV